MVLLHGAEYVSSGQYFTAVKGIKQRHFLAFESLEIGISSNVYA